MLNKITSFCNNNNNQLFHQQIKWIVIIGQTYGLLPVIGVTSEESSSLSFSWYSKKVFYSEIMIFGSTIMASIAFYRILYFGYSLSTFSTFVLNANSAVVGVIFFQLAKEWPKLIQKWTQVETSLGKSRSSLKTKFYLTAITVMGAAIVEHILFTVQVCTQISDDEEDKLKIFFEKSYSQLFDFFEFSVPLAIFAVIMDICNVFTWNFLDVFLMIVSIGLTEKFRQLSTRITTVHNEKIYLKNHWIKLREDYNKISVLCKMVNKKISTLILVSFGINMFFIMSQLYWNLGHKNTTVESIYFSFSFGLLVLRTFAVTLFASCINDESKKSMDQLLELNSDIYNPELEKFAFYSHSQPVVLTGNEFFTVTRGLLFSMTGSIVTYELFLIQSNETVSY